MDNSSCITCPNKAEHFLDYTSMNKPAGWSGYYCTSCFVKKLRGMVSVLNSRIKKQCKKCGAELKDKRMKVCDDCQGMVFKQQEEEGIEH